jgi:hypothetical protein
MLDQLTKALSLLAFAGLYLSALFNIGFFYVIGFHFIGVIDVSNLVYTFGFVFFFVLLGITLLSLLALLVDGMKEPLKEAPIAVRFVLVVIGAVAFITVVIWWLYSLEGERRMYASAILFPVFGVIAGAIASSIWAQARQIKYFLIGFSTVLVSLGVLLVGKILANHPLDDQVYDVITKSGDILQARIARSSGSGFILVKDKKVIFVPTGEVKSVSTTINSSALIQTSPH